MANKAHNAPKNNKKAKGDFQKKSSSQKTEYQRERDAAKRRKKHSGNGNYAL